MLFYMLVFKLIVLCKASNIVIAYYKASILLTLLIGQFQVVLNTEKHAMSSLTSILEFLPRSGQSLAFVTNFCYI